MSRNRTGPIGGAGLIILALAVCSSATWAESPVQEVAYHALDPKGPPFDGDEAVTLWIDGIEYEGECDWAGLRGHENTAGSHGFAQATFTFPDLGAFEIWERYKTVFDVIEPTPNGGFYRYHTWTGIERIVGGTGAFENAHGVFHLEGYTEWRLTITPGNPPLLEAKAEWVCTGMIHGIELPDRSQDSGI